MAFCAWCGNQVPQVSYALCPRCGNPSNGAQRVAGADSGGKAAGLIIGLVVGGLFLIAILGIIAAIAIPNMMTAMQRSKQKRSMADIRSIATATEAYAIDKDVYPASTAELAPKYMATVPSLDGWATPLKYECWPEGACTTYAIGSAGKDKVFERESLQEYMPDTKTTDFNNDIVYSNGKFLQYPEGAPSGGQ
jgi:type II secretory pathway pseudopilin PulG